MKWQAGLPGRRRVVRGAGHWRAAIGGAREPNPPAPAQARGRRHRAHLRRAPRQNARSCTTAIRWGWPTPRRCRRRIRWGWTTSPSTRARSRTSEQQPDQDQRRQGAEARRAERTGGDALARQGRSRPSAASRSTSGASLRSRPSSRAGSSGSTSTRRASRSPRASRCSRCTARNWCRRSANTRSPPRRSRR